MRDNDIRNALRSGDIWCERHRNKDFHWGWLAFLFVMIVLCLLIVKTEQRRAELSKAIQYMEKQSRLRDSRIEALLTQKVTLEERQLNCVFNLRALQEADRLKSRPLKHYGLHIPDIAVSEGGAPAPPVGFQGESR